MTVVGIVATMLSGIAANSRADDWSKPARDRELAAKILQDERMDEVVRMGHELLKSGMNAGSGYSEVWIRDLNTFIVPLLDVAPQDQVREALLVFFHFQGEDGNIVDGYVPKEKGHVGYKYRFSPTRPEFKAHKNTVETDQESSLVQAVGRYVRKTGDRAILDEIVRGIPVRRRLEMALEYPLKQRFSAPHALVWGATTADWGDVQPEHDWGVELDENSHRAIDIYDNALLLVAIGEYLDTVCADDAALKETWTKRRESLRKATRKHLWDGTTGKFVPHIYLEESPFPKDFDEDKVYYHGGTAVAIEAGLLTRDEIFASLGRMRENVENAGASTIGLTLYPPYPVGSFLNKAMGPYSYQNGGDWTWFGARMVRALARNGLVEESYRELMPMMDRVLKHRGFFEWWTPDNQPKGSGKFRGSAGVLIEAIHELRTWASAEQRAGGKPSPGHVQPRADGTSGPPSAVIAEIDWPGFIGRHDLVWDALPGEFDYGAFLGNGMLGAMLHQDGPQRLRWEMGRSDVTEHRRDNARLPIGGLVLTTVGKIRSGTMRMDLWNAEIRGTLTTDKGTVTFRSFIHTHEMALVTDLDLGGGEVEATLAWEARPCVDRRNDKRFDDPPNPPAKSSEIGGVHLCTQRRLAGGMFATAWKESPLGAGGRRVVLNISDSFPGETADTEAVNTVHRIAGADIDALLLSHRDWWHAFYPGSFVSVPDPRLESFYWIQFYKLACASRSHLVPVDLLGPWYRKTNWPRIWWNLNIQTLYLPVYTGNRLELGESFTNFLDAKRENFYRNAREIWGHEGCATVPHTTCYEGLRGDGSAAPDKYINPGDFTWALHNYYLHYRFSMNHAMVTDQSKHAFYPLLRDSINLYLRILEKGDDGRLHLPTLHSPEYGDAADNNYNLSLLRWGCQTLLDLNERYRLEDPLAPTWRRTLAELTPYPVDELGLRVGADVSYRRSHRHWSHLLMVHPLHIMTGEKPEERELLEKSVLHWLTVDKSKGINGWSRAAAASLYATLGDGNNAIRQVHGHMADKRFVRPNTMYIEGSPVIECAIVLARSLQDMLLQSWGGRIAVFPAIPDSWDEAVFHDLRAEGAFLVSAMRSSGHNRWVRIRSLAGEPCRVQPNIGGGASIRINGQPVAIKPAADGSYELPLAAGDEAVLSRGDSATPLIIRPLPTDPAKVNPFGSPRE